MAKHEIPEIQVEVRDRLGSRYAKRLRDAGRIPAVIYGHQKDAVHVSFDYKEMVTHLLANAHLFKVIADGKTESCLVKDVQWDYLGNEIVHLDLTRVNLSETVTVEVKLTLVGEAVGLKDAGAMLSHPYSAVEVECRADSIPETISLNVAELETGGSLTPADLELPAGVKCTMAPDTVLASISIQKIVEEEEEVEAEAVEGEPEVIGEKTEEPAASEE
jgi:large subunit ribosomal protein L25